MKAIIGISLFFVCIAVGFFSCSKDSAAPGCTLGNYGTVTISNTSSDPYDFYLDDEFTTTIKPNSISDKIHIKEGKNHKLYVKQVSGYVISPTERTKYLDVTHCNDYDWQIP